MKSFLAKKKPEPEGEGEGEGQPAPVSPAATAASSGVGFDREDGGDRGGSDAEPKSKKSKSGCCRCCCCACTCRRLLCSALALAVLAAAAVLTWRYGPWLKNSPEVESLALLGECPGCCNGLESSCDVPVNEVLLPMVHRAHSSYDHNFVGAHNARGFEGALVAGYRALQLSACACERLAALALLERDEGWGLGDSNLGFCHGPCGAGVRDPKEVLTNLKTFLDENAREVLIVELDMGEGSSADLRAALRYSGLLDYVYQPPDVYYIEEWPTLGQLVEDNTRLLLFGSGEGMESCPVYECADGILHAPDHLARTATDGSDLDSCAPSEATASEGATHGHFLMNHFATNRMKMPSPRKARELNAFGRLEERMAACGAARRPNLLAVEFWDEGDAVAFARVQNSGKDREGGEDTMALEDTEDEGSRKRGLRLRE